MSAPRRARLAGVGALLACCLPLHAQNFPDAGTIQRDIERQGPVLPPRPTSPALPPQAAPAAPSSKTTSDEPTFRIGAFKLQGVQLLPQSELQTLLAPWLHRPLRFIDLEQAKQAIADLYRLRGWLARPQLPEQDLQDGGELQIDVTEARLGEVRIEKLELQGRAARRIDPDRIRRAFTARQQEGDFLYMPHIERAISLLNDSPGLNVSASLATGSSPGSSDVLVSPVNTRLGGGTLYRDNTGSRSTGAVKDTMSLSLDNPEGLGDQFLLSVMRSEGVNYGRLAYNLPVGDDGWRLGLNASRMLYRVITPLSATDPSYARGSAKTLGLNLNWPAWRSSGGNVYVSASYDRKHFINEVYNPDAESAIPVSYKRADVLSLALNGDRSDPLGQGGVSQWSLGWTSGSLDLSRNTQNQQADQQGMQTEGRYQKILASASRLQRQSPSTSFWVSLQGQYANRNLDSSEDFSLGGVQGVRAYPTAEATGDQGWLFTLEQRRTFSPQWQGAVFYDHGQVKVNHRSFSGANGPGHVALKGWGASLGYSLRGWAQVRLTWAQRLGSNPLAHAKTGLDTDGSLVRQRLWLTLNAYL